MNSMLDTVIDVPRNEITHDGDSGDSGDSNFKEFPTTVFPTTISRFIREASQSIVCPPELVGVPLLVMFASAIGASRVIRLKADWTEGPSLYAACIARPGDKKTPAANKAMRPAGKVQSELRRHYQHERNEYERVNRDDDFKESPAEPVMERTLVEDTTIEALSKVLNDNPRGVLVHRDELSAWIRSMDQYKSAKGSDRQFWLSAWSSSYVAVDRRGQQEPIMLERPSVSVYGGIQPQVLHEVSGGREDGLLDRFIFAYPEPMQSYWSDADISDQSKAVVMDVYKGLRRLNVEDEPTCVHFDADAHQLFKQLVNDHRAEMYTVGFPERLRGPWSKLEAYLARLTLILSLIRSVSDDGPERIESQDVLKAHALVEYFKDQTRKVYGQMYEADPIDQLAIDVVRFVGAMGGYVKDEPSFIHMVLQSEHKPERSAEFSKQLKKVKERTPTLEVDEGHIGRGKDKKRALVLSLKNAVPAVPAVPTEPVTRREASVGARIMDGTFLEKRYEDGRMSKDELVELGTRLILYYLGQATHDWQRHTEAVRFMERRCNKTDDRLNGIVPF